jgi:hypothetical protein
MTGGGLQFCACTYDACTHDSDCQPGTLCACHGSPYTVNGGNTCFPGNCRIDSDCGPGGYCSPSPDMNSCSGTLGGYYCHVPGDRCVNDSDCPSTPLGPGICTYTAAAGRWTCGVAQACGGTG